MGSGMGSFLGGVSALASLVTASAAAFGFLWARARFKIERTHYPQIEFDVDCNIFGPVGEEYLGEFRIKAHNKGNVRQDFESITLRVRSINENDKKLSYLKVEGKDMGKRLDFPNVVLKKEEVLNLKNTGDRFFVEPGICQEFIYVSKIPQLCRYLSVHASFIYDKKKGRHTTKQGSPHTPDGKKDSAQTPQGTAGHGTDNQNEKSKKRKSRHTAERIIDVRQKLAAAVMRATELDY
ncbi:MAG: hypothetical protein L3J03_09190 [Desulfobacterales bacterium]|nr:hypothetical protein [Desulfobacterales bacterium]